MWEVTNLGKYQGRTLEQNAPYNNVLLYIFTDITLLCFTSSFVYVLIDILFALLVTVTHYYSDPRRLG